MPPTTTKPTVADVTALVAEALNWSHPWTTEQSERVAALAPYVRLFYSRLNEARVLRQYPLGCRVQVLDYKSKYAGQIGVIDKHYYEQSPTRGPYIDSVRVVIDAAADAIAVPYLSHIRKVE
ncbi:MAG: hypothetical protein E6Q97_35460 [Desulfurellales bacterium]|nr:MAG: hypothetical protein E6Q97_35460 [Desulfurellales bacterium]